MSTPAPPTVTPPQDGSRPNKTRLPSLDQLAARISANSGSAGTTTTTASSRPRLAASLLARTSTTSVNTTSDASIPESTAVQPSSTRDGSPARSVSPTESSATSTREADAPAPPPGNELTAEHLERLNISNGENSPSAPAPAAPSNSKAVRGYKNVPSLEAITQRLRLTRQLSIDGTEAPPPLAPVPAAAADKPAEKPKEHPLQHPWTLYYDTKARPNFPPAPQVPNDPAIPFVPPSQDTGTYEANLTVIGDFDTVEEFCRYFNWLKPPSRLERNSNYHLFKSGIKPMWEDEANANGGKWVLTMKNQPQLLDRCWSWLAMAMVGEELDETDEICGAVVSLRSKVDRIQLWIRSKDDVERINGIGKKLVKLLDISEADGIGLEFQYNTDERPTPQKFLSIQASFPQSSFRSTFGNNPESPNSGPGVGRGNPFGAGGGGAFGQAGSWRGRR